MSSNANRFTSYASARSPRFDFFANGGEMGTRIRAYDWATTSLGPPERWPAALKTTLRLLLTSNSPMIIFWGQDLIMFYNDALLPSLGPERHPGCLGQGGRECWRETWHLVGAEIEQVISGGGAVCHQERLVPITRFGRKEEVWWSYGYSPIEDDEGIRGVLVLCNDVTQQRRARENLRESYQALFESMDEGFCVLEILFDGDGHPVDFVIAEINPAFEQQTGLKDATGKRVRDLVPGYEQHWIEAYGKVASTGEAIRFSQESPSLGRWFEVYGFRIGDASRHRVGVLFQDITEKKRVELERERFAALVDSSTNFIGMADINLKPFFINRSGLEMVGLDSLAEGMEKSVTDFFYEEDQAFILNEFFPQVMREGHGETEIRLRHFKTKEAIWMLYNVFPITGKHGEVNGYATASQNITQRKKEEAELYRSRERFRKIVSQAATGVVQADHLCRITLVNQKFCDMLGRQERALLGRSLLDITEPPFADSMNEAVAKLIKGGEDFVIETQYRCADGSTLWTTSSVSALRGPDEEYQGLVAIIVDINDRKRAEEEVRYASLHDALTGLPNRSMLFEYANHLLAHNKRARQSAAVLFVDLDRFKPINDTHGHETGDAVLKEAARRLRGLLRTEDLVTRLGGDEFVIFLQNIGHKAASELTNHIMDIVSQPYCVGELALSLSASVGISMFPKDGTDIDTLLSHADLAMYQAKERGRNNCQFYDPEFSASERLQLSIERRLRATLKSGRFHLCYQPVIDVCSGEVVSVEALMRWDDASIGPDQFIPTAESTGLINPIGRWSLHEVVRQHREWMHSGLPPMPVAVNVSVVEFREKDFVSRFQEILASGDMRPGALQIEITETAVMEDLDHAVLLLSRLRQLGVKVLLDDFGSGYSSLSYLARLPLDKIKIDKSFVLRLGQDLSSEAVTAAMIALGRTLNLEVVAEGIETKATLDYVRSAGCHQAQGFYLARPMTGDDFARWYREAPPRSRRLSQG